MGYGYGMRDARGYVNARATIEERRASAAREGVTGMVGELPTWEHVDCGGIDVERADRPGGIVWLRVDTYDRSTAREVAEGFGRIVESDITGDGRWSFAVVPAASDDGTLDRRPGQTFLS